MSKAAALQVQAEGSADWNEPGVYFIADGIFRIPLPMPQHGLRAVNVYVLGTDDGLTLIDAGWDIPEARTLLAQGIEAMGFSMRDIKNFLITHFHRDHYELSMRIRREVGATIHLGQGERVGIARAVQRDLTPYGPQLASLRAMGAAALADQFAAQVQDERVDPAHYELPDEWITDGPIKVGDREVLALATPGHTRGHTVFHDESACLLFSGDHVLPSITPSIGFEVLPAQNPLRDFMESLRLLRARSDARLLPAHGPVINSVHTRVDQLLAHHERRLEQTERALHLGARTAIEIARQLTWTRRERALSDLTHFNQMLAVCEAAAHADLLVTMGRAARGKQSETTRYWLVHQSSLGGPGT